MMFLVQRTFKNDYREVQMGRMEAWNTLEEVKPLESFQYPQLYPIITWFYFSTQEEAERVMAFFFDKGFNPWMEKAGKAYEWFPEESAYRYIDYGFKVFLRPYYMKAVEIIPKAPLGKFTPYYYVKENDTGHWCKQEEFASILDSLITESEMDNMQPTVSDKIVLTREEWVVKIKETLKQKDWSWYLTPEEIEVEP